MNPKINQLLQTKPAEIRQNPDLYKLFTNTFEATFGYKPTCSCSFFNDLQKLRNHLKNQQNQLKIK